MSTLLDINARYGTTDWTPIVMMQSREPAR
jgi:trehalose-6-phosphate synthase